jgi:hypothetical protein
VLDRLVERPTSWSSVGHRAGMAGSQERAREREEGDDRWGQDVSEREGAWARVRLGWVAGPRALLGRAGADASARA